MFVSSQVWVNAHVLAVQPQNAPVLPGDHQQHHGRPGYGLQRDQLLPQRGEQTPRHRRAGPGECESHGECSSGAVLQPPTPHLLPVLFSSVYARTPGLGRPVISSFLPLFHGQVPARGKRTLYGSPEPVWWDWALRSHERMPQERACLAPVVGLLIVGPFPLGHVFWLTHGHVSLTVKPLCGLGRNIFKNNKERQKEKMIEESDQSIFNHLNIQCLDFFALLCISIELIDINCFVIAADGLNHWLRNHKPDSLTMLVMFYFSLLLNWFEGLSIQ